MVNIKENENKHFTFKIDVKGAELKDTHARLIFEEKNNLKFFPVTIGKDGASECSVKYTDVNALKEGKIFLEVFADSVYFKPWEDTYNVKSEVKTVAEAVKPSVKPVAKPIAKPIVEAVKPKPAPKVIVPDISALKKEYKTILKENRVSFLNGNNEYNLKAKKFALNKLLTKYGIGVKESILKLNSINIDELIIL